MPARVSSSPRLPESQTPKRRCTVPAWRLNVRGASGSAPRSPRRRRRRYGPPGSCARRRGSRRRPSRAARRACVNVSMTLACASPISPAMRPSATIAVSIMPGTDRGDADLVRRELRAQRLREAAHGELARDVRGDVAAPDRCRGCSTTLTTWPPAPRSTIFGTKKWQPWTTPRRLMPSSQSQSSSEVSRNAPPTATPALLTMTSAAGTSAWTASANAHRGAVGDIDLARRAARDRRARLRARRAAPDRHRTRRCARPRRRTRARSRGRCRCLHR